jgi:archaellum component FlaG (FlaF/FlaG flagellin family)
MGQIAQYKSKQSGAVLVVALMFLVAITLLTVSSMRSSKIGLHMAQNEESRIVAEQAAQALADAIVANPGSTPVVGVSGFTVCTVGEANCNRDDLPVDNSVLAGAVSESHISARVERTGLAFRPPPRIVESSVDKFSAASFKVTTTYDRTADGLGRQQVSEGVLVLVPKQ